MKVSLRSPWGLKRGEWLEILSTRILAKKPRQKKTFVKKGRSQPPGLLILRVPEIPDICLVGGFNPSDIS